MAVAFEPKTDPESLKHAIVTTMKILDHLGLCEYTAGHASARIPGTDTFLVSGHLHPLHRTIASLTTNDLVTMDVAGNQLAGKLEPPDEVVIHTEVYRRRPDVGGIVHVHPPVATALSCSNVNVLPINHRGVIFRPKVPILATAAQIQKREQGEEVAEALANGFALVLKGHGSVCVGANVQEACVVTASLEYTAKIQLIAMQVGTPEVVPGFDQEDGFPKGLSRGEFFANPWTYLSSLVTDSS